MTAVLAAWTFVSRMPSWVLYVILAAVLVAAAMFALHAHDQRVIQDYQAKLALAAGAVIVKQDKVTTVIQTKYVTVAAKTQAVAEHVKQEVSNYALQNPGSCIDSGFVRGLRDATADSVPDTAGRADAAGGTPSATP